MDLRYGVYRQNLFITSLIVFSRKTPPSVDGNENLTNKGIGDLQTGTVLMHIYVIQNLSTRIVLFFFGHIVHIIENFLCLILISV